MKKILVLVGVIAILTVFGLTIKPANAAKKTCTTIQSGELLTSGGDIITTGYDMWGYNYQANMFNGKYCDAYRDAAWCQPYVNDNLMMKWNDAWLSNQDCDGDLLLDRHSGFTSYIGSGAWLTNHQSGEYTGDWSLVGDWVLDFVWGSGHYVHDMTIVADTTGTGAAQFSSQTWMVTGTILGDSVNIVIDYDNSPYEVLATGLIAPNGSMSGIWASNTGQSGTWTSTEGVALMPMYYWNYFVKIVAVPDDAENIGGIWYTADGIEIGPAIWGEFAVIQEIYNDSGTGDHGVLYKSEAPKGFGFYQP